MSSSRMIIHEDLAAAFIKSFCDVASHLSSGSLKDVSTMIGPIINAASRERLQDLIDDAVSKKAVVKLGGNWVGNRLMPTVITDVTEDMKLWQQEVFGPIAAIRTVVDHQQALDFANATPYGLSASVFTNDLSQALSLSQNLQCGMVHINEGTILEEAEVPFGGIKDSGFGREGLQAAIDDLTEWKWVTWKGAEPEVS